MPFSSSPEIRDRVESMVCGGDDHFLVAGFGGEEGESRDVYLLKLRDATIFPIGCLKSLGKGFFES